LREIVVGARVDGKPVRGIVSAALESAGYRLYLCSADEDALLKYRQTRTELIVRILSGGFGSGLPCR
jgi:hypothetical protein